MEFGVGTIIKYGSPLALTLSATDAPGWVWGFLIFYLIGCAEELGIANELINCRAIRTMLQGFWPYKNHNVISKFRIPEIVEILATPLSTPHINLLTTD